MTRLLALFVLSLAAAPAFANLQEEIGACSNAGNTIEINECTADLAAREETRMREELARAAAVLHRIETFFAREVPKPRLVQALNLAQAAWTKYRETQCRLAVALAMGRSVRGLDHQACLASLNEERANRLNALRVEYEALGY